MEEIMGPNYYYAYCIDENDFVCYGRCSDCPEDCPDRIEPFVDSTKTEKEVE